MDGNGNRGNEMTMTDPFTEEEVVEVLNGVKTGQKWHLAGKHLSPLFYLVLTDQWEHLQDAPYYEQFFKFLLKELNSQPAQLVEVRAHMVYRYAAIPEKHVRRYMDDWRDDWAADQLIEFKGQAIQVSSRGSDPNSTISVCLMTPRWYEIIALDV